MRGWWILLLALPSAAATPLYAHFEPGQDFVLATEPPHPLHRYDRGVGLLTHSTCGDTPLLGSDHHVWTGRVSPYGVSYFAGDDGFEPYPSKDRGLLAPVHLEDTTLVWYLATQATGTAAGSEAPPMVVPGMRMDVTLAVDEGPGAQGAVLAEGSSGPVTLAGEHSEGVAYVPEDGFHVYELVVPLRVASDEVPVGGFALTVAVSIEGGCEGFMPDWVRLYSSPARRPHLDVAVEERPGFVLAGVQRVDEAVVGYGHGFSPWGAYDVVDVAATIRETGERLEVFRYNDVHVHAPAPDEMTLVWRGPPDGTFHLDVRTFDQAGLTYEDTFEVHVGRCDVDCTYVVAAGAKREAPAGVIVMLVGVGVAAWCARRS